jgi:hypothetical protein
MKKKYSIVFLLFFLVSLLQAQDIVQDNKDQNVTEVKKDDAVEVKPNDPKKEEIRKTFPPLLPFGFDIVFMMDDGGLNSAPPPILPNLFAGFSYPLFRSKYAALYAASTLDVSTIYYCWNGKIPVPVEVENREAYIVWPVLAIGLEAQFALHRKMFVRVNASLAADLRIVLMADGIADNADEAELSKIEDNNAKISEYFYKDINWLLAAFSFGFDFRLSNKYSFGIDARMWLPLSEGPMRFGAALRFAKVF